MGIFDNMTQVDAFENSKYFQEGRYIVQIKVCKTKTSDHKGTSVIVEATVLATTATHEDGPKVGERGAQVWSISGEKKTMGLGNLMSFLCASFQTTQGAHDDDAWKAIVGQVLDDNALAGQIFGLDCHMKKTRTGGDYTVHSWRGPQTAEQLAAFGLAPDGSKSA